MNQSRRHRRIFVTLGVGLALVAAACGSDDEAADTTAASTTVVTTAESTAESTAETTVDSSATTEADTAETDASTASTEASTDTTEAAASDLTLTEPVKIALLIPQTGASAIPEVFEKPMEMAVEQINADGGIGGLPVEFTTYDTGFTPEQGTAALRQALEDGPTVLMGYAITSQVLAASELLNESQLPLMHFSSADETNVAAGGSPWTFRLKLQNSTQAAAATQFLIDELGAKKFGLMYTNSAYGTTARDAAQVAIEAAGGEVIADRSYAQDATDLTEQVLAMEGADAVLNWGFPNTIGLQLNQMFQNGIDIPTIDSDSAVLTFENELADPEAMSKFYGAAVCNPTGDDRPYVQEWAAEFEEKYGFNPDANSAFVWDGVYMYKMAIEEAGGTDGEAIKTALESTSWDGGVCQTNYEADENHNLSHDTVIISLGGDKPETVAITEG